MISKEPLEMKVKADPILPDSKMVETTFSGFGAFGCLPILEDETSGALR